MAQANSNNEARNYRPAVQRPEFVPVNGIEVHNASTPELVIQDGVSIRVGINSRLQFLRSVTGEIALYVFDANNPTESPPGYNLDPRYGSLTVNVGRNENGVNPVVFPNDQSVSRTHCTIQIDRPSGTFRVADNSTYGTKIVNEGVPNIDRTEQITYEGLVIKPELGDAVIPPREVFGYRIEGLSVTGNRREKNDDRIALRELDHAAGFVCTIADGVGGHEGGNRAAQLGSQRLNAIVGDRITYLTTSTGRHPSPVEVAQIMRGAYVQVDKELRNNDRWDPLGNTTLTSVWVSPTGDCVYASVGDSRLYHANAGKLEQIAGFFVAKARVLTHDDTYAAEALRNQKVGDKIMAAISGRNNIPPKNILSRSLGPLHESVLSQADVAVNVIKLDDKDRLLLCTDGVTLNPKQINSALVEPNPSAARIVQESLDEGSTDNVSAIVISRSRRK